MDWLSGSKHSLSFGLLWLQFGVASTRKVTITVCVLGESPRGVLPMAQPLNTFTSSSWNILMLSNLQQPKRRFFFMTTGLGTELCLKGEYIMHVSFFALLT